MKKLMLQSRKITLPNKSKLKEDTLEIGEINKYKLDEEAVKHDSLFKKASEIYGKKVRMKYETELELSIVKDEIAEKIKKNPTHWGLKSGEKLTESLLNRIVVKDQEYLNAYHKFILAKSQEKEWEGIKSSIEQRGWMIKLLYNMWEKNYF